MIKIEPSSKTKYCLSEPYTFQINSDLLTIPEGYESDGASIPKYFWKLIGTPFSPSFIEAAFVHDFLINTGYDAKSTDKLFRSMLIRSSVSKYRVKAMYHAVSLYRKYKLNDMLYNFIAGTVFIAALASGYVTVDMIVSFLLW